MVNEKNVRPRYAKPKTACHIFGIGMSNLYNLLGDSKIESVKIGTARREDLQSMESYFESLKDNKVTSQKRDCA